MPNEYESDGGNNGGGNKGVSKRKTPNRTASYSGYSTDESALSTRDDYDSNEKSGSGSKKDKKRSGGRRPDPEKGDGAGASAGSKASMIWMVLVIGLTFCMMDAMYIVRVLDRGHEESNLALTQQAITERIMKQLQDGGRNGDGNAGGGDQENNGMQSKQQLMQQRLRQQQQRDKQQKQGGGFLQGIKDEWGNIMKRPATKEEREAAKKRRQEEAKKAEEDRIQKIKMAAFEALKAEGGNAEDFAAIENDEAFKARPMAYYRESAMKDDKWRVLQLFTEAGLKEMDDSTYKVLPSWSDVSSLYGGEPNIVGLEQCEAFRAKGNPWDHFVSTAGTFNSGTNLMAELLIHNCHMQARMDKLGFKNRGIRWQVPWGKHTPPGDEQYRLEHKSIKDKDVDANMIIPAVTVRDPYYWMQSMCKHHYTASWRPSDRCPNLIPNERDIANNPFLAGKDHFPLSVKYADFRRHHESLSGLWNDWYNEYMGVEFQRLFVRYEDLLFHPKNITETVCKCAGGQMNKGKFSYVVDSAKKGLGAHGKIRTGYIDAIIKYGSERNRYNGWHPEDLKYAREHLDATLMEQFGYKYHPMTLEENNENNDVGDKNNAGNEHEDEPVDTKEEKEVPEIPKEEGVPEVEESADLGDKDVDIGVAKEAEVDGDTAEEANAAAESGDASGDAKKDSEDGDASGDGEAGVMENEAAER